MINKNMHRVYFGLSCNAAKRSLGRLGKEYMLSTLIIAETCRTSNAGFYYFRFGEIEDGVKSLPALRAEKNDRFLTIPAILIGSENRDL